MTFEPGQMIGPYRIEKQIGRGGMATVYKAYHVALERDVAIKVLHKDFLSDASFLARFQREARVVARLEHPNIVPVYDFAEFQEQPYLVMKYVQGETLKDRLKRGPLSKEETLWIVETVGNALSYAHKKGILHRDIKPSNIILESERQLYLADFGLARITQSRNATLTGDMIVGTPQYISPEQAMGQLDIDEGADIYSFGVMLYEMVVGHVPFDADTPFSIIQDHLYSPLPLPSASNPEISFDLEQVILKSLAKRRSDRFASVKEMVDAFVEAWKAQGNVSTRPKVSLPSEPELPTLNMPHSALILAYLISDNGQSYPIKMSTFTLGRTSPATKVFVDLDLTALDVNKVVSRRHAIIEHRMDVFTVADLGSTNGTFLNGKKLAAHVPAPIKAGDVVELGQNGVKLTFAR
jgi:serine/threonine-protein kinase